MPTLRHKGESAARIAQLLDHDPGTIRDCFKEYRDGGLKAVYEYEKHESELEEYGELIEKELIEAPLMFLQRVLTAPYLLRL